jgi:hypothetical protein
MDQILALVDAAKTAVRSYNRRVKEAMDTQAGSISVRKKRLDMMQAELENKVLRKKLGAQKGKEDRTLKAQLERARAAQKALSVGKRGQKEPQPRRVPEVPEEVFDLGSSAPTAANIEVQSEAERVVAAENEVLRQALRQRGGDVSAVEAEVASTNEDVIVARLAMEEETAAENEVLRQWVVQQGGEDAAALEAKVEAAVQKRRAESGPEAEGAEDEPILRLQAENQVFRQLVKVAAAQGKDVRHLEMAVEAAKAVARAWNLKPERSTMETRVAEARLAGENQVSNTASLPYTVWPSFMSPYGVPIVHWLAFLCGIRMASLPYTVWPFFVESIRRPFRTLPGLPLWNPYSISTDHYLAFLLVIHTASLQYTVWPSFL